MKSKLLIILLLASFTCFAGGDSLRHTRIIDLSVDFSLSACPPNPYPYYPWAKDCSNSIGSNDTYALFNKLDTLLYYISKKTLIVNTPGCPPLPNPNYPYDASCNVTIGNNDIYACWYVLNLIDSIERADGSGGGDVKGLGTPYHYAGWLKSDSIGNYRLYQTKTGDSIVVPVALWDSLFTTKISLKHNSLTLSSVSAYHYFDTVLFKTHNTNNTLMQLINNGGYGEFEVTDNTGTPFAHFNSSSATGNLNYVLGSMTINYTATGLLGPGLSVSGHILSWNPSGGGNYQADLSGVSGFGYLSMKDNTGTEYCRLDDFAGPNKGSWFNQLTVKYQSGQNLNGAGIQGQLCIADAGQATQPNSNTLLNLMTTANADIYFEPMTLAQRNAISSPAAGNMVYCSDTLNGGCGFMYNGHSWKPMNSVTNPLSQSSKIYATVSNGGTVNLVVGSNTIVDPGGAIAGATVHFPAGNVDGDVIILDFANAITTVTYTGSSVNVQIIGAAGSQHIYTWNAGTITWY